MRPATRSGCRRRSAGRGPLRTRGRSSGSGPGASRLLLAVPLQQALQRPPQPRAFPSCPGAGRHQGRTDQSAQFVVEQVQQPAITGREVGLADCAVRDDPIDRVVDGQFAERMEGMVDPGRPVVLVEAGRPVPLRVIDEPTARHVASRPTSRGESTVRRKLPCLCSGRNSRNTSRPFGPQPFPPPRATFTEREELDRCPSVPITTPAPIRGRRPSSIGGTSPPSGLPGRGTRRAGG